jgi:hypothetical protein
MAQQHDTSLLAQMADALAQGAPPLPPDSKTLVARVSLKLEGAFAGDQPPPRLLPSLLGEAGKAPALERTSFNFYRDR